MSLHKEVEYLRPESLAEAWEALAEMKGSARPVWVSPQPPDPAGLELESYVDLSGLGLEPIKQAEEKVSIGAGARLRSLQDSNLLHQAFGGVIHRAVRKTAHQSLRNLASLGAVLLEPDTAPELGVALLIGDPTLLYFDGDEQSIKLADAWQEGSVPGLPLELQFERSLAEQASGAIEWVGRSPMDKAMVTAASSLVVEEGKIKEARVAAAGDGFSPQLLTATNEKLAGSVPEELDRSAFEKWVKAEIDPTGSYRASVEYQLEIAPILAWRALMAASEEVK